MSPIRIALSTVGSTGDIQPFLALGRELISRGHDVIAISHPFHRERFERYGIPFRGCGPELTQGDLNDLLDRMIACRSPLKQLKVLLREAIMAEGETYYHQAREAMKDRQLVVSHMIDFLGHAAAKSLNIPRIGVVLTHSVIPTPVSSPALIPNIGWLNPLAWKIMTILIRPVDREIQAFLQSIGAPTLNIKRYAVMGDLGNIVAASETLAAVPSEFLPHNVFCTGPWSITGGEEHPNQELIAFLNRHPHPIVVSLGSMGGTDGQALTERIVRAIRTIGLPAVIQNGYAGLNSAEKDELLHFTGFVSHEYLFPRAKLVVHHGGAGTTAAVCKAGVPSVVIAFIADQPYFGKALQNIGLAPKLIWHYKLSSQNLAGRIRLALKPQMQEKAKQLKSKFENEKGVDAAADWIEQRFLHNRPEKP